MSFSTEVTVVGIKDALKQLNKIAPSLRREITKEYKTIVRDVIQDAQAAVPDGAPMTGMNRTWSVASGYNVIPNTGWNGVKAEKMIQAKISTRKVKEFRGTLENVGTFRIVWTGIANTTFDVAGRKSKGTVKATSRIGSHGKRVGTVGGPQMIAVLNARYGMASRAMWPAWQRNKTNVDREMQQLCDKVMKLTNQRLVQGSDVAGFSMEF